MSSKAQTRRTMGAFAILILTVSSACGGGTELFIPYWNGELALEERQSIEEYQQQTEPVFYHALVALEDLGFGDPALLGSSEISKCSDETAKGYSVRGPNVAGEDVDVDEAKDAIDSVLSPAGFDYVVDDRDEISTTIKWFDVADGGYFSLTIKPNSHTAFGYVSGCRPSDGTSRDPISERVTPQWELEIPNLTSNPTPGVPSEPPTSGK